MPGREPGARHPAGERPAAGRRRALRRSASARAGGGLDGRLALALRAALGPFLAHSERDPVAQQGAPASPDFSGWNWVAAEGPFSTAATKRSPPCSAQVTSGARVRVRRSSPSRARRRSARSRTARPRRRRTATCRRPASTVFQPMCGTTGRLQPLDDARPLVAARGLDAVLDAALEEDLHADADAEHRSAAGQPPADHLVTADRPQAGHARGERADAGHDEPVGLLRRRAVGGQRHLGAGPLEGAHGRAEVARPVVEDDARSARRLGQPSERALGARARPSRAGRARRRRATPGRTP